MTGEPNLLVSDMAQNLISSEIIKLAADINARIKQGENIYNLTIGDFNPDIFTIPEGLKIEIQRAYDNKQTNYPPANGLEILRVAVANYINDVMRISYSPDEVLISAGARPIIYGVYKTLLDPDDKVLFPVPSWNNNHYSHLHYAGGIPVETSPENNFMPTADDFKDHVKEARFISLCSPLNPTGTVFNKEQLTGICDLVLEENARRVSKQKPLYVLYDQIYWQLTYGDTKHINPVNLRKEMRPYTISVDGISKCFAATGVRVGWATGPKQLIDKLRAILSHIGAWSPRAEQSAVANFLNERDAVDAYLKTYKSDLQDRLTGFYNGFKEMSEAGLPITAIAPQAAMYLTVSFNLFGYKTADGKEFKTTKDITDFLVNSCKLALVPFSAFGASEGSQWYRLAVGVSRIEDIDTILANVKQALEGLQK